MAEIEVRGLTKEFGRVTAVRENTAVFAAAAVFTTLGRDVT